MKFLRAHYQDIADGKCRKVPWPWTNLSQLCPSLTPGSLTIIAGAPGASKSFMMLQCLQFWQRKNVRVALMMLEGSKDLFMRRCLAQMTSNPNHMDTDWIEEYATSAMNDVESFREELGHVSESIIDGTLLGYPTFTDVMRFLDVESCNGARILILDPITMADGQGQPWVVDVELLLFCQGIAKKHGTSIILVTHPAKNPQLKVVPSLDALARGVIFQRIPDAIIWLEKIESKEFRITSACGTTGIECDRRIHLLKVRDGRGQGMRLGYKFVPSTLLLAEQGVIVKEKP